MNTLRRQIGLSLVEILVALAVSLLLLAGVTQIFLGTRQSFRLNENLAQVQESGQFAIEQMSRTIRMAGATGCPNADQVANTVRPTSGSNWWIDLSAGWVRGFDEGDATFSARQIGTGFGDRTANSDAIYVLSGTGTDFSISQHVETSATIHLARQLSNLGDDAIQVGEILIICDSANTAVFQVTNTSTSNNNPPKTTLNHTKSVGNQIPGNCSKGLGYPTDCISTNGNPYTYHDDAIISKYAPSAYYIGNGSNGRPALFLVSLTVSAGNASSSNPIELVQNVENLQITYSDNTGSGISASAIGSWSQVRSLQIELLVSGTDTGVTAQQDASLTFAGATVSNADQRLRQVFTSTVGIRNRLP